MERIVRRALELGQNHSLLLTSHKIPTLRKREKMDNGREKKRSKLETAVREFVGRHFPKKWPVILKLLEASANGTQGEIYKEGDQFVHEKEEKPKWSKSTMENRIQIIHKELRDAKKSKGT
jgi:hypothetical protein